MPLAVFEVLLCSLIPCVHLSVFLCLLSTLHHVESVCFHFNVLSLDSVCFVGPKINRIKDTTKSIHVCHHRNTYCNFIFLWRHSDLKLLKPNGVFQPNNRDINIEKMSL